MSARLSRSISESSNKSADSVSSTRSTSRSIVMTALPDEILHELSDNIHSLIQKIKTGEFAVARHTIKDAAKTMTKEEFNKLKIAQIKSIKTLFRDNRETINKYGPNGMKKITITKLKPLYSLLQAEKDLAVANLESIMHQSDKPFFKRMISSVKSYMTRGGNKLSLIHI